MPEKIACEEIIASLSAKANPANMAGMARYGINTSYAWGLTMPFLRGLAKKIGKNHDLARCLWESGFHEARILACLIDEPAMVSSVQMEEWVRDFNSWDLCDQCCSNLFDRTPYAYEKAILWAAREEEFVKRAGFVIMAALAVHDKKAKDESFFGFLPIIIRESHDTRNFVRKAVNWALRQIGKRNRNLNQEALAAAEEIRKLDSKAAKWIAGDAIRELSSASVQKKIQSKNHKTSEFQK